MRLLIYKLVSKSLGETGRHFNKEWSCLINYIFVCVILDALQASGFRDNDVIVHRTLRSKSSGLFGQVEEELSCCDFQRPRLGTS